MPILLLLLLFLRTASSLIIRNCSTILQQAKPRSVYIEWTPPAGHDFVNSCLLTVELSYPVALEVTYYSRRGVLYSSSSECDTGNTAHHDWFCPQHCQGLFYSSKRHSPQLARSLRQAIKLATRIVRVLYCRRWSGLNSPDLTFVISASDSNQDDSYQDPVWRVLGPVLATVCMVATVFLICVCYVQHAYQRGRPTCCRWINAHLRGTEQPAAAGVPPSQTEASRVAALHRHVEAMEDMPPAYDDFRKYHRPCSFGVADRVRPVPHPPSYSEAVRSLQRTEGCDSAGVDNPSFLRDDVPPPPFSVVPRGMTEAVQRGMTEAVPHGVTEAGPRSTTEFGPRRKTETVPQGSTEAVQRGMTEAVPRSTTSFGPRRMTEPVQRGMTEAVPHGVTEAVQRGMTEAVPHGMTEAVPHGITEAVPRGTTEFGPRRKTETVPHGSTEAVQRGMTEAGPPDMAEFGPRRMTETVPRGVTEAVPHGVTEAGSRGMTEATSSGMTEADTCSMTEALSPDDLTIELDLANPRGTTQHLHADASTC